MNAQTFTPRVCAVKHSPLRIIRFFGESQIKYYLTKDKREYGQWLKTEMSHMGPAFIKLGQFLSTRTDLLDKEITVQLARLQDDITPTPFDEIVYIIEESLGKKWQDVFTSIDPTPIACASIGQVHTAMMGNRKVVIKVQKPCVARQIRDDLETLEGLNQFMLQIKNPRASEVENLLYQYERFLSAELDYRMELDHMQKFETLLDGSPVKVPKVYKTLSSERLLVMEYVPSIKISDLAEMQKNGIDTSSLANMLVDLFLQMIVVHGYVHCDPHPGNIGVSTDGETIVLYDFGNVIELSKEFRSQLNNLVISVYQKDVDEFVDLLLKLRIIQTEDELDVIDIKVFFASFFDYLQTLDFAALRDKVQKQQLFADRAPFKLDPEFLSLFRVFSLLDGTCSNLDSKFNYFDSLKPYTDDIMQDFGFFDYRARRDIEKLQNLPRMVQSTNQSIVKLKREFQDAKASIAWGRFAICCLLCVQHIDRPLEYWPFYVVATIVFATFK